MNNDRTIDPTADPVQTAIERYEVAWKLALASGLRPNENEFLADVPAADRARCKWELSRVAAPFERQLLGATLDPATAAEITHTAAINETLLEAPAPEHTAKLAKEAATDLISPDVTLPPDAIPPDVTMNLPAPDSVLAKPPSGKSSLSGKSVPPVEDNAPGMPVVPGFIILGELGRGGMGVVYKARQKGLNRLVALKMVLSGAHASPEQLARFHTEGQAVAELQHPNIVQIYEVGEHEGLPYFSLEFVDGGSLQQKYDGKPQPAREAAEMIQLLALAMACAHDHGVIHRDLKPANILLSKDGLPKITDFGLAKRLEADDSQTRSGTLMGTPSYMAPEQAKGKTHDIGPLADVYALGVMLYEAITGRVPFIGATVLDTLQQVQTQEPVPPSRLIAKVPVDLETICLKCLQKEPKKRYESAEALAEDLIRFQAGEPIKARPVGNAERLWRWCKRNPRVAALSATLAVMLVVAAVASTIVAFRMAGLRQDALSAKELAVQKAEDEAAARAVAVKKEEVANKQANLALQTIQTLVSKVQERLEDSPGTAPLKRDLLLTAEDGLNRVDAESKTDTKASVTMAATRMKMAELLTKLGEGEAAIKAFKSVHEFAKKRAKEVEAEEAPPNLDAARNNVAATSTGLGDMNQNLRRNMIAAVGYYRDAIKIREEILNNPPPKTALPKVIVRKGLAACYGRLGATLMLLGDPAGARDASAKALAIWDEVAPAAPDDVETQKDYAKALAAFAEVAFRLGDEAAARERLDRAFDILLNLKVKDPKKPEAKPALAREQNPKVKETLARTHLVAGDMALRSGRLPEARKSIDAAVALSRELVKENALDVDYLAHLATALARSATVAERLEDAPGAKAQWREAAELLRGVLAKDPGNDRRQMELMTVLAATGDHIEAAKLAAKLCPGAKGDAELLFETARCYALCAGATNDTGARAGYAKKALEALEAAIVEGYKDGFAVKTEPALDGVRNDEAFKDVLAKITSH